MIETIGHGRVGRMLLRARRHSKRAAEGYESLLAIAATRYEISGEKSGREYMYFLSELAPYFKATDARDLCYAFLGFQKNSRIQIQPNYLLTVEEVFEHTSRAIIKGSSSLNIFGLLARGSTQVLAANLPSWAPDWSAEPLTVPLYGSHLEKQFSACRNRRHRPVFDMLNTPETTFDHVNSYLITRHSLNPTGLWVRGKVIDIVDHIHSTTSFAHSPRQHFDIQDINIQDLFDLHQILRSIHLSWATNEPMVSYERLLRTILANGVNPGDSEIILQREASGGLYDWRLAEFIETYNEWQTIQTNVANSRHYEAKLNAEALLAYGGVIKNRHVINTRHWRLGIAPNTVANGDYVCILHGSNTPVILRAHASGAFRVVGQAYIEGIMHGEVVYWGEDEAEIFQLL